MQCATCCNGCLSGALFPRSPSQETDKAAYLLRQHVRHNLYDLLRSVCEGGRWEVGGEGGEGGRWEVREVRVGGGR